MDPNRYKITKQADTVMLFFLFRGGGPLRFGVLNKGLPAGGRRSAGRRW
jgi:hypothetical protein